MEELLKEAIRVGIDTSDLVSAVKWYQILELANECLEAVLVCAVFTFWGWCIWRIVKHIHNNKWWD